MSYLLDEIRAISRDAADVFESEGFKTDSEIMFLNRQDLLELLPGKGQLRVRKTIHERICQRKQQNHKHSVESKFKELMELLSPGSADADVLVDNKQLREYLHLLKTFIEKLNDLLERNKTRPYDERMPSDEASGDACTFTANSASDASAYKERVNGSKTSSWKRPFNFLGIFGEQEKGASYSPTIGSTANNVKHDNIQRTKVRSLLATVRCKIVVSGNTLGAHSEVMKRLNGPVLGCPVSLVLNEVQHDEDSQVTIVFCPIVSRVGTDVDAALQYIASNKPIIVVVMHHLHTPTAHPAPKTSYSVHHSVNVFFHETKGGLLDCSQNHNAINEIKEKLLQLSPKKGYQNPQ